MSDQQSNVSRRNLLSSAAAAAVAVSAVSSGIRAAEPAKKFKLKYAPSLGQFQQHAGKDPIDQLKFMADEGFSAMFDNGLPGKPPELQEKIATEMTRLGMTLGPFVMYAEFSKPTLVTPDPEFRDMIVKRTKDAVEVAKRANAKWALMPPAAAASGWNGTIRRLT
jgi:hydroxypyruvate isomerase